MKTLTRLIALFVLVLIAGVGISVALMLSVSADTPIHSQDTTLPTFPSDPLLAPANGATLATFAPTFDWLDATDSESSVVSYTLVITGPTQTTQVTTTASIYTSTDYLPNGVYTWTVQAYDEAGNMSGLVEPPAIFTISVELDWQIYLPLVFKPDPTATCPASSNAAFNLIPIDGPPTDHPDYLHGDLNLSLRGYDPTSGFLGLVNISGSTDPDAPQLAGLFGPNRFPGISAVYRVYSWNWACGTDGCRGPIITNPAVTLTGLVATPGEPIFIPERNSEIFNGGYKAMVLYAEAQRITLGYTRQDTVVPGYTVHLENICVDPNLLALYRAQINSAGGRVTGHLPGLRNNQALGTALGSEVRVAIRDKGAFLDPRSRKDWWQGY